MEPAKPTNYWDYIRVEEVLSLQGGLNETEDELDNSEVLFITVHQIYELWFKLVLREMRSLRDFFHQERVEEQAMSNAARSIKRVVTVLRQCVTHFEVIETLTTREYLGFRDKLMPASGFQSAQLRQIEILMGLDDTERVPLGLDESYMDALRAHDGTESPAYLRVQAAKLDTPSLAQAIEAWLFRTPIGGKYAHEEGAEAALQRFVDDYVGAHARTVDKSAALALARAFTPSDRERLGARYAKEKAAIEEFLAPDGGGGRRQRVRAAMIFLVSYRELPLLAWPREVLDGLIELEQVFVIFRQRHARMVERVIGRRTGTGGSEGVDYLDRTALNYRVFRDLWAVRTYQIPSEMNPDLEQADFYDFRNG